MRGRMAISMAMALALVLGGVFLVSHELEGAAKMTVTRMRQRFRALVRQELAHTVLTGDELEQELRDFTSILRR